MGLKVSRIKVSKEDSFSREIKAKCKKEKPLIAVQEPLLLLINQEEKI